ncbi:MAG: UbiA family prenyltransferase [Ardenticatenia bacterium]|nr:UbiA family prenyltransferase [Ardenticatenia bacterium]
MLPAGFPPVRVQQAVAFVLAVLKLMRAHSAAGAGLLVAVGGRLAGAEVGWPWLLPMSLAFLLAAAGNADNDIHDVATDWLNRPTRPLPAGELSVKAARRVRLALVGAALVIAVWLGGPAPTGTVVALALTAWYTRALKGYPLAGHLVIGGLTAAPLVYGGLLAGNGRAVWWAAGSVASFFAGREVVKAIRDLPGDRLAGWRTVPVAWGDVWAWRLAAGLFGGATGFAWYALWSAGLWPGWALGGSAVLLAPSVSALPSRDAGADPTFFLAWSKVAGLLLLVALLVPGLFG